MFLGKGTRICKQQIAMSVQKFNDFIGNPGFDRRKIATMNLFSFVQILVKM